MKNPNQIEKIFLNTLLELAFNGKSNVKLAFKNQEQANVALEMVGVTRLFWKSLQNINEGASLDESISLHSEKKEKEKEFFEVFNLVWPA